MHKCRIIDETDQVTAAPSTFDVTDDWAMAAAIYAVAYNRWNDPWMCRLDEVQEYLGWFQRTHIQQEV